MGGPALEIAVDSPSRYAAPPLVLSTRKGKRQDLRFPPPIALFLLSQ